MSHGANRPAASLVSGIAARLQRKQAGIEPVLIHQDLVAAVFNDPAPIDDHDLVSHPHRGEAV